MELNPQQLPAHLKQGLRAAYLVCGDEALLTEEAGDLLRRHARAAGYSEREVYHAGKGFDWNQVLFSGDNRSLFGERRIIEIRLPDGNAYADGGRALEQLLRTPPQDTVIIMFTGKLNRAQKKTKWYTAFKVAGVCLETRAVDADKLPAWIAERLRREGLAADAQALQLMAQRLEGNLLAAHQEIKTLRMVFTKNTLNAEDVSQSVADSSRHDVYKFIHAALARRGEKISRMLGNVRAQGGEAAMVSWALARQFRALLGAAELLAARRDTHSFLTGLGIWRAQQQDVLAAARRRPPRYWRQCLLRCARVDRMIKLGEGGDPWDEFLALGLKMAR